MRGKTHDHVIGTWQSNFDQFGQQLVDLGHRWRLWLPSRGFDSREDREPALQPGRADDRFAVRPTDGGPDRNRVLDRDWQHRAGVDVVASATVANRVTGKKQEQYLQ